ncbi:hypothetical protein BJ875DRAFT_464100 [Amylocarpus encephaloides]|uniref:Uncharacterized protein n=1 Tax=Amylocarpus encephaloides TaxID=45428 RepID=A0A9P7YGV9_9HELO|nr:hypothetical protein BJ875DRAFT_464100 [Amylocarpus encephaloides]
MLPDAHLSISAHLRKARDNCWKWPESHVGLVLVHLWLTLLLFRYWRYWSPCGKYLITFIFILYFCSWPVLYFVEIWPCHYVSQYISMLYEWPTSETSQTISTWQ